MKALFTFLATFVLGALIALYERAVGLYASLVHINAYHQPGVEAGKKAAAAVLDLQGKLRGALDGIPRTAADLAARAEAPDEAETASKILEHLAANPGRGVLRVGDRHPLRARYIASLPSPPARPRSPSSSPLPVVVVVAVDACRSCRARGRGRGRGRDRDRLPVLPWRSSWS